LVPHLKKCIGSNPISGTNLKNLKNLQKEYKMKPGTVIRLQDGRIATIVYNGLDGYGIM